jgi:selenide, water dikinase
MPMGQLTQVLRDVQREADDRLLVGPQTVDDAGVVILGEAEGMPRGATLALVQTVDYFPPVLDDPYLYGAVAAANALSDVYAMGGKPFSVLNLAGFPKGFREDWVREIFRGGFDKVQEAGAVIAGGHTVESGEPLFGFAVTGVVDQGKVAANAGAQVGDVMYLTKGLGMGSMTTGGKFEKVSWEVLRPAAEQMAMLNDKAAEAMNAVGVNACTDITGFGLIGHSSNIGKASGVTMAFELEALPIFPGAYDLAAAGVFSGGTKRGKAALADVVNIAAGCDQVKVDIAYDAETSGGLLIVLPADRASALEAELGERGLPIHRVGEVRERSENLIDLS